MRTNKQTNKNHSASVLEYFVYPVTTLSRESKLSLSVENQTAHYCEQNAKEDSRFFFFFFLGGGCKLWQPNRYMRSGIVLWLLGRAGRRKEADISGVAHFRRSPDIDRLKSQKTDCSNPPQDLGPIKIQFRWSSVPLFSWCRGETFCYFPTLGSLQKTDMLTSASGPQRHHVLAEVKWPCIVHNQSALRFFLVGL